MALLNGLLDALLANHQTTLLLAPGSKPRYRTGGRESDAAAFVLDGKIILDLLEEAVPDGLMSVATPGARQRLAYCHQGIQFDLTAALTPEGWSVAASKAPSTAASTAASSSAPEGGTEPALAPPSPRGPSPVPKVASLLVGTAHPPAGPTAVSSPTDRGEGAIGDAPVAGPLRAPSRILACSAGSIEPGRLPDIGFLLAAMLERQASDLHLSAAQTPRLRLHGSLTAVQDWGAPSSTELTSALNGIMPPRNQEEFKATNDTDFAHEVEGLGRFRVNIFRERQGIGAVFRHIPFEIPSFEELGLPEVLREITSIPKGLVLVTGPTGSGKSTTLACMIDLINHSRQDHIITIEDPIEFVHRSDQCLVTQREVGPHTGSFHHALRAALREDPDIVMVGEMRDLETMSTAIHTAETGHLVFGTLHTTSAPATVERLIGQFPGELQAQIRLMLADSLRAVVSQALLKRIGGGRAAAFEVLLGTPAVTNLIREGKTFQIASSMQTGKKIGMRTMTDSLFDLVVQKIVDPAEAYGKAVFKEALASKLDAAGIRLDGVDRSELVA